MRTGRGHGAGRRSRRGIAPNAAPLVGLCACSKCRVRTVWGCRRRVAHRKGAQGRQPWWPTCARQGEDADAHRAQQRRLPVPCGTVIDGVSDERALLLQHRRGWRRDYRRARRCFRAVRTRARAWVRRREPQARPQGPPPRTAPFQRMRARAHSLPPPARLPPRERPPLAAPPVRPRARRPLASPARAPPRRGFRCE